jgi:hypothetical protein
MDHIVYTDAKSGELEKLLDGKKTMIIRGATGRKLPYGKVLANDELYFIRNNGEGLVIAKAVVTDVFNSEKMDQGKSIKLVENNQDKLHLDKNQFNKWAGKRYLVFINIANIQKIESFKIDKSEFSNMDDWLPVEDINSVRA